MYCGQEDREYYPRKGKGIVYHGGTIYTINVFFNPEGRSISTPAAVPAEARTRFTENAPRIPNDDALQEG